MRKKLVFFLIWTLTIVFLFPTVMSCSGFDNVEKPGSIQPAGIAFITRMKEKPHSYLVVSINNDSYNIMELGTWYFPGNAIFYQCWSADRTSLVHIEGSIEAPVKWLSIVNANGTNHHRLFDVIDMNIRGFSLSPDGETVIMAREERKVIEVPHEGHIDLETKYPHNIYAIGVNSGECRQLTDFLDIQAENPVFSPDGSKIAFIGRTDDPQTHFDIYVIDSNGKNLRRLTHYHDFLAFYQGLQWSPDGKKIYYGLETLMLSDIDHYDDIFVLEVASGESTNLTNTREIDDVEFRLSPDGKRIAFMSGKDITYHLYVMDSDGTNTTMISKSAGQASWMPDSKTLIATGRGEDGISYAIITIDTRNFETNTLLSYTAISDNYSNMSYPVWLGK